MKYLNGETVNRRKMHIMYAIIKTGGKQIKAEPGRFIDVEKLDAEVGAEVTFDALMVVDGDNCTIGTPVVEGLKVTGKVIRQDKQKTAYAMSLCDWSSDVCSSDLSRSRSHI